MLTWKLTAKPVMFMTANSYISCMTRRADTKSRLFLDVQQASQCDNSNSDILLYLRVS